MTTLTATREWNTINPISNMPFKGIWVVRDSDGNHVDHDQYRNDLKCRHEALKIVGD